MLDGLRFTLVRLLGLRGNESRRLLPLAVAYGLVLASLYVLKPARNALFLSRIGADELPLVLITVAVLGGATAVLFARAAAAHRLERVLRWTFPTLGLCLVGFWLWLSDDGGASVFLFYVWVNLYGHLATALIWLLANAVFDAREARRVFGVIGAVGIAGAVFGGAFTRQAVQVLGTHDLLLVCAAFLMVAFLVLARVRVPGEAGNRRRTPPKASAGVLDDLRQSPLLRVLALMALMTAVVSAVVDVQFNRVVNERFESADEKTAFFGLFFAVLNGGAFLVQLLLTSRLLAKLGLGPLVMLLPVALALGSGAVFLLPTLASVALLKAADGGLRHSVNKSALEILFVPIPSTVKQRAKVFLDATVDNLGTGIGALGVLLFTGTLGLGTPALSLISAAAIAAWMLLALHARGAYVDAFRNALERRELNPEDIRIRMSEASQLVSLLPALRADNPRQVGYALDMLQSVADPALVAPLVDVARRHGPDLRARAIHLLGEQRDSGVVEHVEAWIDDADPRVRLEAMHATIALGSASAESMLSEALASPGKRRRAALDCIARYHPSLARRLLDDGLIRSVLDDAGPGAVEGRASLALALGAAGGSRQLETLMRMTGDEDARVVASVIEAVGAARHASTVDWLISCLNDRRHRSRAIDSLIQIGTDAVPPLGKAFAAAEGPAVRRAVVRALRGIATQPAVDVLLEQADHHGAYARLYVLKALNKLRIRQTGLTFRPARVHESLDAELRWYVRLLRATLAVSRSDDAAALLHRVLIEKRGESLDRAFRLLALLYPPQDIYNAFLGVQSDNKRVRAHALEFLENVLERSERQKILALVEPEADAERLSLAARAFSQPELDEPLVTASLLERGDDWVRACALYALQCQGDAALFDRVRRLTTDPDPIVRETAQLVLSRGDRGAGDPTDARTRC